MQVYKCQIWQFKQPPPILFPPRFKFGYFIDSILFVRQSMYHIYSLKKSLTLFLFFMSLSPPQMSWNGSEQLEKAMEEMLDDDDDDEVKVEKSSVEKMEKHINSETRVPEPQPAGIDRKFYCWEIHFEVHVLILLS